ncbi:MAG: TatD family hydrolase [Proteobacteria bacterium]|nr:TatD family hydrolase [Pseudomonadota bacterium]MBU4471973.1 TatD family hydrolase [Pseudomonadota bacterium]MCG2753441.1 TatD family hydrolase [Desulfobacteraceae bacterium]
MRLFDSHCHLDDSSYDPDLNEVLQRAIENRVLSAMVVGTHLESSRKAVVLADRFLGLYASVGVHPHDAKTCSEAVMVELMDLAKNPKVRAWGETGLDFNRMFSPRADQEKWFLRQLEVADSLNLPVILHERDSLGRFYDILKDSHNPARTGVVHCFSGNKKEMEQVLDLGYHIGITGIVTQASRGETLRKLVPRIPADRLLIETDAPYLTPAPHRNKFRRNEPAFVLSVLLKIAEVRKEDPETLGETLWQNTCRLYQIKAD